MSLSKYRKAIVAAVTAGAGALTTANADGVITSVEWAIVALTILGGLGFTWAVPNAPDDRSLLR